MQQMTQTGETPTHLYYQTQLDDQLIKLIKDKATGELSFDADSVAIALGYPNQEAMLADDRAADAIREYAQETGEQAIRRTDANGHVVLP